MTKLQVSAILPNYNYAHYFSDRLDQILDQTYPISELIILDDASTDNSRTIIEQKLTSIKKQYPTLQIKTAFNTKNSGNVFSQWQNGIKLATCDYLWICELDDVASPTFLEHTIAGFSDSSTVLSYANSRIIDQHNKLIPKANLRRTLDFFRRRHLPGDYIVDGFTEINKNLAIYNSIPNVSAVVIKNHPDLSQLLSRAKNYHLSGDWFFYLNLATKGKIAYCAKSLNGHRIHTGSVTSQTNYQDRFAELQQIHHYAIQNFPLKPSTKNRIQRLERRLARNWNLPIPKNKL